MHHSSGDVLVDLLPCHGDLDTSQIVQSRAKTVHNGGVIGQTGRRIPAYTKFDCGSIAVQT